MLLTPCGVDFANTLLYHLKPLQLSFSPFFLFSPTLSEGYNTQKITFHVDADFWRRTKERVQTLRRMRRERTHNAKCSRLMKHSLPYILYLHADFL